MTNIDDSVIVVAHPDDEVLWFSSILNRCRKLIFCFGPSATSNESWDPGRAALINNYPRRNAKFLNIRQSEAFGLANWKTPAVTDSGLKLQKPDQAYSSNAANLAEALAAELAGEKLVVTHNPWGEYGNEEHVQIFRVLSNLRKEARFELLVNSYVSNRSFDLMMQSAPLLSGPHLLFPVDTECGRAMKSLYMQYDCWTWREDYEWPAWEAFYNIADAEPDGPCNPTNCSTASPPMNYLNQNFNRHPLVQFVAEHAPGTLKSFAKRLLRGR